MKNEKLKKHLNQLLSEGLKYLKNNFPKKALDKFQNILVHKPNNENILNFLGICFFQLKNYKKALFYIKKAIENNPKEIGFYINLGNIYKDLKDYEKALEAYLSYLKINKKSPELFYNIGILYAVQHKYGEAVINYKKTLKIDPTNKFAFNNLANVYKELSKFTEAIELYKKAIKIDNKYFQAHFNLGLILLLKKPSSLAWEKYEYRESKIKNINIIKNIPKWEGSNLKNKTLLIVCEQGIGDNVQFIRYVKKIKKNQSNIFLLIKKNLISLFENIDEVEKIFINENDIPSIDFYISSMSLPFIFRHEKSLPPPYRFFKTNLKLKKYWELKLNKEKKIKIGIIWQGDNLNHKMDFKRSVPLKILQPILELKEIKFVSLQKDFGREQIKLNKFENLITDFYGNIDQKPFEDTLSIIESLDMIISSDTSIAHIAATMNKNTWIMIPRVPDWRWGLKGQKTIWYDNVKLYRQKKINNWSNVINDLKKDLIKKYNLV